MAAGRRCGAHGVGDDVGVVTLVQVDATEVQDHLAAVDVDRAQGAAVADRRRWREAGEVGQRDVGADEPADVDAAPPAGAEHDGDVVTLDAGAAVELGGRFGSEGERVVHRLGILRSRLMRTIEWRGDHALLIDQTRLPSEVVMVEVRDVDAMIDAIRRLVVRGAPAIGVAGAFGVAIAAQQAERDGLGAEHVRREAVRVTAARPTAVNLAWAVRRVLARLGEGTAAVVAEAEAMADEDVATNRRLAARGADLLEELGVVPARLHTHCNTGGLATVEWGTALGIVRELHARASGVGHRR